MNPSIARRWVFLFWGGMLFSALGGFLFVKPSIASPLIWFLLAIASLIGAAFMLPNRYRVTALVVASLCLTASFITVRQNLAWERHEKIRKLVAPMDLPQVAIGAIAPDINANDLSGNEMSLSQHRGKVVLLVFWATWCGPCMGAVTHEKELVERFAGRPFVLVGVNCNDSTAEALDAVEKHSIPWKSFWNGEGGSAGQITTEWGVQAWPTVYVIDHIGVIRHRELHGLSLDEPLERLIAAAEAPPGQPLGAKPDAWGPESNGLRSPDPALDPTAGLPNSDDETKTSNNANGDLRTNPAVGPGDPHRAQDAARNTDDGLIWGDPVNGLRSRVVPVLTSMGEDAIDPAQRVTKFAKADDVAFVVEMENVSDKPIKLLDTRYGENYGESKGKAKSDWFGQFLFSIELFDGDGQKIERPEVHVVDLDGVLDGAMVASLEPGKSHRFLLRPAKWLSAMTQRIEPGHYRAAVTYHGVPACVVTRIKEYRPDSAVLAAVEGAIVSPQITFEVLPPSPPVKPNDANAEDAALPIRVWGEPSNGLRAAIEFLPRQVSYAHGEKLEVKLHMQNYSKKPITLSSHLWLSELKATVKNEKGEPVAVDGTWYSGWTLSSRVTLKPKQIVIFDAGNIGLAVSKERADKFDHVTNRKLVAPAGKYSMQLEGRFGNSFLLKDGKGKVLAPLEGDWIGELQTGADPLTVTTAAPDGIVPRFVGTAKLTIPADAEPQPVELTLRDALAGRVPSALDPTAGLPNSDDETKTSNNANGDLRSKPAAGSGDPRRSQEVVKPAIERGIAFLKTQQQESGAWPGTPADGVTALCAAALLQAGVKPDEPVIQKTLAAMRKVEPAFSYTVALQTMVFCMASPKDDAERIRRNVTWLEQAQATEGPNRGAWSYAAKAPNFGDGSCSRFAMLGLHAAKRAGFEVKAETWRNASDYYLSSKKPGSHVWGYTPEAGPTPTMTLAAMAGLAILNQHLPQDEQTKRRTEAIERAVPYVEITAGGLWNAGHGFYSLHGAERAAHLNRWTKLGKYELSKLLDEKLMELQKPDGSWAYIGSGFAGFGGGGEQTKEQKEAAAAAARLERQQRDLIATSFALLALTGQPEPMQNARVEYKVPDPASPLTTGLTDADTDSEARQVDRSN